MPGILIVAIVLAGISAIFALQNSEIVAVSFLGWDWEASLALILILTLGVGIVIGYLAGLPAKLGLRGRVRKLERDAGDSKGSKTVSEEG
jgi:uncharacterized integral membrane protein